MRDTILYLKNANIYQKNLLILSNVNLKLERGAFSYLIGKTGSGKSSLLKVLYGDLPLLEGEGGVVDIDLVSLKNSEIPILRRKLGIVFQDFQLLTDRTVEKNLIFVLKATGWKDKFAIGERVEEVLDSVGMGTKKHKMPHELSGGEQQRVAIARALLNHPALILADEPTGNLDPETSNEIMILLKNISKKNHCAILMATHDYSMIKNFPAKTIKCEDGKIFHGDSEELFVINE
ncbi:cell division ATP-binding protein FtsE [Apibacter adventoris]|uniref:Cell division ATP-binding protein FtsE n=1 Tax=Apibacter adventoris TaxID=1679466 RepID=A0A2S8A778_9FLAO|nr:ATP-binding cassette domain-containing protein [Apibacter adventoris]PQL90421.1 phosphonate ABC transporter ATP-binding protein [Apibacter adventoris]PQL95745.1 phosphonate ABC transporter ATP-binding protein [Apibacter adventoris]